MKNFIHLVALVLLLTTSGCVVSHKLNPGDQIDHGPVPVPYTPVQQ